MLDFLFSAWREINAAELLILYRKPTMVEENGHITADNETGCNECLADSRVPPVLEMFVYGDIHLYLGANLLKTQNKHLMMQI